MDGEQVGGEEREGGRAHRQIRDQQFDGVARGGDACEHVCQCVGNLHDSSKCLHPPALARGFAFPRDPVDLAQPRQRVDIREGQRHDHVRYMQLAARRP